MLRFAANLSTLYTEHALIDRFAAAAADGFEAVEVQFPYELPAAAVAQRLDDLGLPMVLINTPLGDRAAGERGLACLPGREAAFRRDMLETVLPYAAALRCSQVHVMPGIVPEGVERKCAHDTFVANLAWAAREAAAAGVSLMLEPMNAREVPGYFYSHQREAHHIVLELGAPNVQVQMDLYHCQIVEGDLAMKLREYLPTGRVGHIQFSGVPGRHEPDIGELHYPYLFALIDSLGYGGYVSAEYRPRGATSAGLAWFEPYRKDLS